ncbi:MAG: hypothetical protein ACHQIG_07505 [Acidimicrobiia bacterium]
MDVDLTPIEMKCMRCGQPEPMRFYGLCGGCRVELQERFVREGRDLAVAEYEPKMNVTPNAVALKGD